MLYTAIDKRKIVKDLQDLLLICSKVIDGRLFEDRSMKDAKIIFEGRLRTLADVIKLFETDMVDKINEVREKEYTDSMKEEIDKVNEGLKKEAEDAYKENGKKNEETE